MQGTCEFWRLEAPGGDGVILKRRKDLKQYLQTRDFYTRTRAFLVGVAFNSFYNCLFTVNNVVVSTDNSI
jgi:hypothetical protein